MAVEPEMDKGTVGSSQYDAAMARLAREVRDGLRHGFFDCTITCTVRTKGRRELVIRAGKSHKFTIPEHELPG